MMAPWVYESARAEAPMHIQLRCSSIQSRGSSMRIEGRVVRIFRDTAHQLYWGKRISFSISVSGGESGCMPGNTIYHSRDNFAAARWLEAFLESDEGKLELVYSQVAPIRGPTLRPVCGPDQEGFLCRGDL
jgi:hypothetical protein